MVHSSIPTTSIRRTHFILLCWILILKLTFREIRGVDDIAYNEKDTNYVPFRRNYLQTTTNNTITIEDIGNYTDASSQDHEQMKIQCSETDINITLIQLWDDSGKLLFIASQQISTSYRMDTTQCYSLYLNGENCDDIKIFINGSLFKEIGLDHSLIRVGNCPIPACNDMDEIFLFVKDDLHQQDENMTNNTTTRYNYSLYNESALVDYGHITASRAHSFCKSVIDCLKLVGTGDTYYYSLLRDGTWMETSDVSYHTFGYCLNKCDNNPDLDSTPRGNDLQFLAGSLSGIDNVQDTSTMVYKAACWLIYDDPRKVQLEQSLEFIQRLILAMLYYEMNGHLDMWLENYAFLSPLSECQWNDNAGVGVTCNDDGAIIEINLQRNNLRGTIITELFRLNQLQYLDLSQNYITGTLSSHLGILFSLEELHLFKNKIQGIIPNKINELEYLRLVHINDNLFTGDVPLFSSSLVSLDVSRNLLNGTIPSSIGTMISIKYLLASGNELNCTVPKDIIKLQRLSVVNLAKNQLYGSIPQRILTISSMQYLDLSHNALSGFLPNQINFYKPSMLKTIDFSHNIIQGTIPSILGGLIYLTSLNLSHNSLLGVIPTEIIDLQLLTDLQLQKNELTGYIPYEDCRQFHNLITDCATIFILCDCCTECYYSGYDDDDDTFWQAATNDDIDNVDRPRSGSYGEQNNDSSASKQEQQPPIYKIPFFKRAFTFVATAFLVYFVIKFTPRR